MSEESAKIMLKRAVSPCDGGFKLTRDLRHKGKLLKLIFVRKIIFCCLM